MDQYAGSRDHSTYFLRRTHCILYQLPPLLLAIFWILWCRERKQRQMHRQPVWTPPIWTIGAPISIISPFLSRMPFLPQPSQFILAWDR